MENTHNQKLDQLIFYIKRAMAYYSIEKDYSLLKEEAVKIGVSLYFLHKIIEKLNEKNHIKLPCPEIDMFVVNDKAKKTEPDVVEKITSFNNEQKYDGLQYITLKDWMLYAASGIIEMTNKMLKK